MTLTVSMPVYGHNPTRAVESVLAQTYENLRLIVVEDGEDCGPLPGDPRLIRFRLSENRGRYYADAVTLAACDTEWWSPHDADDWSTPDRFDKLFTADADVVFSACRYHWLDGSETRDSVKTSRVPRKPNNRLRTIARYPAGIWRTDAARSVGINAESRGSFDTCFVCLTWRRFKPAVVDEELYHVFKREGSLTTSAETTFRTEWRRKEQGKARRIYRKSWTVTDWPSLMTKPDERDVARLREMLHGRRLSGRAGRPGTQIFTEVAP